MPARRGRSSFPTPYDAQLALDGADGGIFHKSAEPMARRGTTGRIYDKKCGVF